MIGPGPKIETFQIGDRVRVRGTDRRGEVAIIETTPYEKHVRYGVYCSVSLTHGETHWFAPEQLERIDR